MSRTCSNINCNESLENRRPNVKYCSIKCKADAQKLRYGQKMFGLSGFQSLPVQHTNPVPASSANEFLLQQRIQELIKDLHEEKAERKALRNKLDEAKETIAELKRDQAIERIQNEKPGGLSGFMQNLSPEVIEKCAPIFAALGQSLTGAVANGASIGELPEGMNEHLSLLVKWYPGQSEQIQDHIFSILQAIDNMPDEANKLFHLKNVLNNLTHGTTKSTGT